MARIDDYIEAKRIAAEKLATESFEKLVQKSGFKASQDNLFRIPFLNRVYQVRFPDFEFQDESEEDKEVPIQEQVMILHYMMTPDMPDIDGQWIAYREIPGASFYFSAFVKRAIDPLKKVFGDNVTGLVKAAEHLNGRKIDAGDAGFEFDMFPHVPIQLVLWMGDEEFPAEANILFDKHIGKILSPEDVAWLAGMLVYRLIAVSYTL